MPYKRVGPNDYVSPNGKHINSAQLKLWHANGEKWPGEKRSEMKNYAKGGDVRVANYAEGGAVLGRTKDFMKMKDEFRDPDEGNAVADEDQKYGKSGEGAGTGQVKPPKAAGKSLKAVKPRK
jgi:hypothetical protein